MTRRRDLKRRVRNRQVQTGESYMTALLQIRRALHRPELALMREVLIDGAARHHTLDIEDVLRFNRRLEQLRPGVSDSGKMAALYLEGSRDRVLVVLWLSLLPPFALGSRPARLLITSHTG